MQNWHSRQCRKPDVVIYEGLGLPTCMDCGEMAPPLEVDRDHQDELKIPSGLPRTAMNLKWPPNMSFSKKAHSHDCNESLHRALNIYLEEFACHEGDGQGTNCSLSQATSQSEASMQSKSIYTQLHEGKIRILRLSKGRFGNPVHGFLEILDLQGQEPDIEESGILSLDQNSNRTEYEAVSYTWATSSGNRRKDHVIFIGNSWDMLPITENCFDALKNCRLEDRDRYLWIDSICINQLDISERTHQVGMMREIYSAASRVLIYLSIHRASNSSRAVDDPEVLCLNPYFSRIWVVQEIGSAKKALVLYDGQSMSWGFFHANLQRLMTKRWIRHFGRPRQIDDMSSFLALLEDTWDCNATDPRDKVFALLGLWKASLEPDYTLPPQAVYTGLAASFVTDEDTKLAGRVLDMASQGHSMLGLPSWVPDWSVKSQQLYQRTWSKASMYAWYEPSGGRAKRQKFRVHGVTGCLITVVAAIDVLAPYLSSGFQITSDGMSTATVGQIQVSMPLHVTPRCEPTDHIFSIYEYGFFMILRKKADPHIYTFIGLCDYKVLATPGTTLVDAMRYLHDWTWLLGGQKIRPWSKLGSWEHVHKCWLALREQQKVERRVSLRRLIYKAYFLRKMRGIADALRYYSSGENSEADQVPEFFKRRWTIIYHKWREADSLQASIQEERRSRLRLLLEGWKSLHPTKESLQATVLDSTMWLPLTSHWFEWTEHHDRDQLYSHYLPLAACISKHIPLPPLNLVDTPESRIPLILDCNIETGVRQLQLVARDHSLTAPESVRKARSYPLEISHNHSFRTEYFDAFLRWLSKPYSPSISYLRSSTNLNSLLIWETKFEVQKQIDIVYRRLDANFDKHLDAWSRSLENTTNLTGFFNLIYQEQFELLWIYAFYDAESTKQAVEEFPLLNIGAQFARLFWWRFHRTIHKAYQLLERGSPTEDQIEQEWNNCLDWLAQRNSRNHVADCGFYEPESRPKPRDDANFPFSHRVYDFFSKLNYHGWFISTPLPGVSSEDVEKVESEPLPHSKASFAQQRLSEIVHSEIQRRRLPERLFSFLFRKGHMDQELSDLDYEKYQAMLDNGQPPFPDLKLSQEWRQQAKSWNDVAAYVSHSEWHMTSLKLKLLGGWGAKTEEKRNWDIYKEIVVI
ncbi:hypothetical protein NW768_010660 [Fusarium equiseti]|uniref:Heterokaryon incompatibility domain-containing protein n=1 Tax=Fusarium equiseti TaxID=61235 RepID=A0ABQ8QZT0_FUSEQ|nr:hypothetical protein NW768_010660 [Fusarium equiseti]